jgi:CheY-like chemotaxis protein
MSMTATLGPELPFLRRYARALTGSQTSGDAYVRASLEAMLAGEAELDRGLPPRMALYQLFHALWASSATDAIPHGNRSKVEERLLALRPTNREALLLTTVEGFTVSEVAVILGWTEVEVEEAIHAALRAIDRDLKSRIMIIEDEAVIALDLESLILDMGHEYVGTAATRDEAVRLAQRSKPDIILTDIQLADGSSGIDAAVAILKEFDIPVIFITAYPERLLTGERPEPTYFIAKPFSRDTVRATISQALFFHRASEPAHAAAM